MAKAVTQLFATELGVFRDHLEDWLVHDIGRHALIRGTEVLGPYDTENDAIKIGYDTFGYVPFLVKEIYPIERSANFTRDVA